MPNRFRTIARSRRRGARRRLGQVAKRYYRALTGLAVDGDATGWRSPRRGSTSRD